SGRGPVRLAALPKCMPRQRRCAALASPTTTAPATRAARLRARRGVCGESVRLAHENEGRAGDDRGAGADEGHAGILDLARSGAARCLQGTLDDVPEAVDASRAEAAAKGVERQLAVELDAAVLDEIECGAFL